MRSDWRDIHYPLRLQRRLCVRDSNNNNWRCCCCCCCCCWWCCCCCSGSDVAMQKFSSKGAGPAPQVGLPGATQSLPKEFRKYGNAIFWFGKHGNFELGLSTIYQRDRFGKVQGPGWPQSNRKLGSQKYKKSPPVDIVNVDLCSIPYLKWQIWSPV